MIPPRGKSLEFNGKLGEERLGRCLCASLLLPPFLFLFTEDLMASLHTNRQEAWTEIKNYPIFHIRLLRDKQASALLWGSGPPSE